MDRSTLVLCRRWGGPAEILGMFVLAAALDGATLVGVLATAPVAQRILFGAVTVVVAAVAVLFDYGALAFAVNRTEIRVNDREITIGNLPLGPGTHRARVPTFKVESTRVIETEATRSAPAAYRLEIVATGGESVLVDTYPRAADAGWFRAAIEERLARAPGRSPAG